MAVASNPLETFIWGAGGQKMSPEQVARQREIAAALMQGGMDYSPVDHWLQGAARASQGLVGGLKDRWANEAETAGRNAYKTEFDSVFGGGSASPVAAALSETTPALDAANQMAGAPVTDWLEYANQGATRNQPLAPELVNAMSFLPEMGVTMRVVSGGQEASGPNRLGSTRHDHGNAGDVDFYQNGRKLDWNNEADLPILSNIVSQARANGVTGIGAGDDYMGAGRFHIGFGNEAVWGAGGKSENAPDWLRAAYSGAPAPARTQVAQAGGQPSIAQLIGLAGNEWASPGQNSVVQALLGQQMQQQDPRYQQQLRQGDLDYRRSEIELQALMNPSAPPPVFEGGQWWDTSSGMPTALTQPNVDPTSAMQNYEFLIAQGVAPEEAAARAFSGGVNVSVGGAAPAPAQGYQNIFDENGNLVRQEMVVGGPAWQEAQAAAAAAEAQEGAQIASGIEGAEKTLTSTRNVLDLIDNSGGQPTTGTLSIPFAALSGTPAGRIRSYVSTLQSGVALGAMQRLKEASATGATGFGALSAPELNLLISDIGALDPNNTEPDIFRETIQRIDERAKRVVSDIRKNVAPERIDELGLREFLDAIDPDGAMPAVDPNDIDALLEMYK